MRWPWRRDRRNGAEKAAAEATAKLAKDKRMTPVYKELAPLFADLPPEEVAARVARALRHRPT